MDTSKKQSKSWTWVCGLVICGATIFFGLKGLFPVKQEGKLLNKPPAALSISSTDSSPGINAVLTQVADDDPLPVTADEARKEIDQIEDGMLRNELIGRLNGGTATPQEREQAGKSFVRLQALKARELEFKLAELSEKVAELETHHADRVRRYVR